MKPFVTCPSSVDCWHFKEWGLSSGSCPHSVLHRRRPTCFAHSCDAFKKPYRCPRCEPAANIVQIEEEQPLEAAK